MIFSFAYPYVLLLLPIFPLLGILARSLAQQKMREHSNESKSDLSGIPALLGGADLYISPPPKSFRLTVRPYILPFLKLLTVTLLIVALSRPQFGTYMSVDEGAGRDLLLTLDVSQSMKALDFELRGENVSRLQALKSVVAQFIQARKGDRLGILVFGKDVYTKSPLTRDTLSLLDHVKDLEIGMAGDATALGDGLILSLKRLRDIDADSKAIILVTDGMRTAGQIDPIEAASIAKKLGIRVYTIGIGGGGRVPFPTSDLFGREIITYQDIPLDEKTLRHIASKTGGKYFNAQSTDELHEVYKEIDTLEPRVDPDMQLITQKEFYIELLCMGLLFFILHELLGRTYFRIYS